MNHSYFAPPSLSPRGDMVAWGFAIDTREDRRRNRARFVLGVYSLPNRSWKTFGDFDDIGATAYSSNGSRIAFVARTNDVQRLFIFDVGTEQLSTAPYPPAGLRQTAALSWSPDGTRLAVELQRGGLPYSPVISKAEADRNPVIAVLDLITGNLRMFGEGMNPAWSPDGHWIAYYEPGGARCVLIHPDGTARRVLKTLRQSFFSSHSFTWGGPVWSPDSTQLLLNVSYGETSIDLVRLDLATGRVAVPRRNGYPAYGWARRQQKSAGVAVR